MTEKTSSEAAQFTLPFSVPSENRKEPFTKDMEAAAVFSLAERERGKGGGLIMKQPEEKIAFMTKLGYPLWLINWSGLNLVFDGIVSTAQSLSYNTIADAKSFLDNLQRSSKKLETHLAFLSDNINYFQAPSAQKTVNVNGLVRDSEFLSEFTPYLLEAKSIEVGSTEMVMLTPVVDESAISVVTQEFEHLKSVFKEEVDTLYKSMKLIDKSTNSFVRDIRNRVKAVKEDFDNKIKEEEAIVTAKVNQTNEEYNEQITNLTKNFEKQLNPSQKEKVKLEKAKEETLSKIENYKMEAKTRAESQDSVGEQKWKEKANESKKELSETENKIKETEKKIKEITDTKSLETFRLRSEMEAKTKETKKELLELEASRDAKIQGYTRDTEKLEKLTSSIIEQIRGMAKLREANIAGFDKLGIKQEQQQNALIYVPFYLACYQVEMKKRYLVLPPSMVETVGLSTKLKGALGRAKIKQLLVPRFRTITLMLNKIPILIAENAVLEREINEVGGGADMLKMSMTREQIKNGLRQLKSEGWFSDKDYEALAQRLA